MTDSCIFCKIISGDAKATIVSRDERVTAFRDIHPAAPTHILIMPNKHIESVSALETPDRLSFHHCETISEQRGSFKRRLSYDHKHRPGWWTDRASFTCTFNWGTKDAISEGIETGVRLREKNRLYS